MRPYFNQPLKLQAWIARQKERLAMEVSKQGQTWKDSRVSTGSVGNLNLLMKSNQQNSANFQALKQNATNVENIERKQQPALKNILCDVCELPKFNPQENALFCEVFQAI